MLAVTDASGTLTSEQRYLPFGEVREDVGEITQTNFGFTFQRGLPGTGLMDYRARFYAPALGRFIQPDSIVPGAGNPQSLNRYSYVGNDPITHIDPSGHWHSDYRDRMNRLRKAYGDKIWFQYRRAYHRGRYSELPVFGSSSSAAAAMRGGEILHDDTDEGPLFRNQDTQSTDNLMRPSETKPENCPGAVAAGALLIIALAPIDYGLVIANAEIVAIPVIGPVVEFFILLPVDFVVIDLHFVAGSIMFQGSQKPCSSIEVDLLPPWGFE